MSTNAFRARSLGAYRSILRAGRSFPDYNVRSYIVRQAKEGFRKNRNLSGTEAESALNFANEQLSLIQRQSTIATFYKQEQSVMEVLEQRSKTTVGTSGGKNSIAGGNILGVSGPDDI